MGACASKQNTPPKTPADPSRLLLVDAVRFGYINDVTKLLKTGVDPNKTSGLLNRPPLHWAANNGNKKITVLLLEYNADPSIKDLLGQTALDLAKHAGEKGKELIPLLENAMSPAALKSQKVD